MAETRRGFLLALGAAASCFVATRAYTQEPKKKDSPAPDPPQPAEKMNPAEAAAAAQGNPERARRIALKQNEKEFRAGVDRLYQLAGELKQEMDKTATADVFSLQMYKRTEEIEKVAKLLKAKAKG